MREQAKRSRIDIEAVKSHANGRWPSILTSLAGIDGDILDGRHHPCPKCGGSDRFRMIDETAGAVLCNKCFSEGNGDGIAAIQWALGITFPEALMKIAEYLHIDSRVTAAVDPASMSGLTTNGSKATKPVNASALNEQCRVFDECQQDTLIELFCQNKAGITPNAVKAAGGVAVAWPRKSYGDTRCIAFAAVDSYGNLRGYILRRVNGQNFAAIGKLGLRKTHMLRGSHDGWVVVGGLDRIRSASHIWRVEGVPDALAIFPYLPPDHAVITNICGAKSVPPFLELFTSKSLVVVGDADADGQKGVEKFATIVNRIAASVRVVTLPYEVAPDHGKDLRDFLVEGGSFADLMQQVQTAEAWTATESVEANSTGDDRVKISLGTDEYRVNDEAVAALANDLDTFQRGGELVHIVTDGPREEGIVRPASAPRILALNSPNVRERLTKVAQFVRLVETEDGDKEVPAHPPGWCVNAVAGRQQWSQIRDLVNVVTTPVLRPDGSLLILNGYDKATGLFLTSTLPVSVPENPTRDEAQDAALLIQDVFHDFPFSEPHHLSALLACILTVFARHIYQGPAPLFLIDANVAGTGKSLLSDVIGMIALGDNLPRMSNPTDDEEARKRVLSLGRQGDSIVLIDNISTPLGGAVLDAALTATRWKDRILGLNEVIDVPLSLIWIGTGNNVILVGDTSRRVCPIRFESKEEKPEERGGFKHSNLRTYVRTNRAALVSACLTVLRAFHLAGRPQQSLPGWGSYEAWTSIVRQAVVWLGLPDPAAGRGKLIEESDTQLMALRQLIECWEEVDPQGEGLTTSGLLELLGRNRDGYQGTREALLELCGGTPDKLPSVKTVGMKFRYIRGRIVSGRKMDARKNRKDQQVWRVVMA